MADSFDNDSFDEADAEPLPPIGHATAMYTFEGWCPFSSDPVCWGYYIVMIQTDHLGIFRGDCRPLQCEWTE